MRNRYENIDENYTAVYCYDFPGEKDAVFVIDRKNLHLLMQYDVSWNHKKNSGSTNRLNTGISARAPKGGPIIYLTRLIMGCTGDKEKVRNLTLNPFDLRECNLVVYQSGEQSKSDFNQKMQALADKVPHMPKVYPKKQIIEEKDIKVSEKDVTTSAKKSNIRLLTDPFSDKYVLFDGNKIINEMDMTLAEIFVEQFNLLNEKKGL
ncbi:hypothetical protein EXW35_06600 [Bacillus mycoides]|uniref:hypothetical protein n=1 Tax=Bacillus mycoides TaxID=1405 RepID=UPI001C034E4B|nr:hypothetical protein [Bacillus mycoides]QWG38120.1 hypothetical protein EXW35_06600 [Bacillus mycoides]